ncbi:MAG: hypothetical protein ACMUHX_07975 [bacterium]
MIERDRVSGLNYLIIAGAILAFIVFVSCSETFAQWSTFSGSGGYGYPGSFYGGYPGYGYPYGEYGSYAMPYGYAGYPRYGYPESPYSAYPYAYPYLGDGNYSRYVSLGGSLVPREIFELSASSNWNTAQLGYALIKPYFQSTIPNYSSLSGPFSSYYPKFTPTSFSYYVPTSYSTTYDSSSKGNTIVTITGTVVGSYSINSNGREIKCYVHLPQQAVFHTLDLSEYMGEVVEVSGYLINQDLYGASIERVI